MIILDNVAKRYRTTHGPGKWVLDGITLTIPRHAKVGLIGVNGAGKSTLLRLIGGIDHPTKGRVERQCRISWPLGLSGGLQGSLTGRQNTRFVCRIHGSEAQADDIIAYVADFAELGDAFDEPIKTYSSGMRARLNFGLSLAFRFDMYLVDELTAVGDASFKNKSRQAFADLARDSGLIMVSHDERSLKQFCTAGILVQDGKATWFERIDDALARYKESIRA